MRIYQGANFINNAVPSGVKEGFPYLFSSHRTVFTVAAQTTAVRFAVQQVITRLGKINGCAQAYEKDKRSFHAHNFFTLPQ